MGGGGGGAIFQAGVVSSSPHPPPRQITNLSPLSVYDMSVWCVLPTCTALVRFRKKSVTANRATTICQPNSLVFVCVHIRSPSRLSIFLETKFFPSPTAWTSSLIFPPAWWTYVRGHSRLMSTPVFPHFWGKGEKTCQKKWLRNMNL